jgi:putative FmdB family regulatory protein
MPTYDYHCDGCEHEFEHFQTITSPLLTKCPKCGKKKLRRLFGTGAALVFKGSGFYTTDYRSDSYKHAASKDKPAGDGKSAEGKSADGKAAEGKSADGKASGESKSSDGGAGDKPAKSETKPKPGKSDGKS